MNTTNYSKIAEKIRKIVALAESTTSEDEAESFMAKAQTMMMEHGLSLLDLGRLDEDDPVGTDKKAAKANSSAVWRISLGNALATYYGAKVVMTSEGSMKYLHVIGRESARITFTMMIPYVDRQILAAGNTAFRAGLYNSPKAGIAAVANALTLRIWKMIADLKKAEIPGARGMNALVPVDMLDSEIDRAFGATTASRKHFLKTDSNARAAAGRISLNLQTGRAPASRMLGC